MAQKGRHFSSFVGRQVRVINELFLETFSSACGLKNSFQLDRRFSAFYTEDILCVFLIYNNRIFLIKKTTIIVSKGRYDMQVGAIGLHC